MTDTNVLTNGDFSDLTGWTGDDFELRDASPTITTGSYLFFSAVSTATIEQTYRLTDEEQTLRQYGRLEFTLSADLFGWRDQTDAAEVGLFFYDSLLQVTDGPSLDGNANYDGFWESALTAGSADTFQTVSGTVPVDALFLVVRITSTRDAGSNNDGYADNVFLGLHAATGSRQIEGTNDNDRLEGTPFNDVILALNDHDEIIGSAGNDTIYGGEGEDTLDYSGLTGGLHINLDRGLVNKGPDGRDLVYSIERVVGTDGDDTVIFSGGTVYVNAGHGNNTIRQRDDADSFVETGDGDDRVFFFDGDEIGDLGAGADWVRAGRGHDLFEMGDGDDIARMGAGDDTVAGEAGEDRLFGNSGADNLQGGDDNDRLYGGSGADRLRGQDGDDALRGETGQDNLVGGTGDDNLYGGANRDAFIFTGDLSTLGRDRIKDWEDGLDTLNFNQNSLGWTDFDDVLAAARVTGGTNLRIDFDADNFVVIENFALGDFTSDDVSFNNLLF